MARGPGRKQLQKKFEELIGDGLTPEALILEVAQGTRKIKTKQHQQQYAAALALLPYRLPRLNNIDAVNRNVDMSHEDFIKSLSEEE